MDYEGFRSGNVSSTPRLDINLRSIAAFSGIPRETVRRKVAELVKRGWVVRAGNGSLAATAKAKADLEPLTDASIQYLGAMLDLLASSIPATREKDRQMEDGAARED